LKEVVGDMTVYLVQHGNPVPKEEDPDRPLSAQGRIDVEKMAAFLKRSGVRIEEVIHSTKTRARQTAELMAAILNPRITPMEKTGLSPMDDVHMIAEEIDQSQKELMIVGHLPHLAMLSSFLITGGKERPVIRFQQGGVVCLKRDQEYRGWTIAWVIVPERLPPS
jgi:phosphohistidine phosphatase